MTNLATLFILVDFFHIWYLLSAVVSFATAMTVGFLLQKFFAFKDYTKEKIKRQTALYFAFQLVNLYFNTFLMYVFVDLLDIQYLISQILIGIAMAVYSFFIYKHLVFYSSDPDKKISLLLCLSCSGTVHTEWGNKNNHTLMRCTSCGLIFVHPMPEETSAIYNEKYFSGGEKYGYVDYDRDKEPMRHAFELYLEYMEDALGRKGKLLDVGCATGYFMDIAKKRGWEVGGVEISEHAAKEGRARGLAIHTGILEDVDLPERSFDAVTFLDVIEHLRNPEQAMLKAKRLLKEGGIIVVSTPDAGSLWANLLGPRWHLVVPPEHLILFGRKNFSTLLFRVGFSPVLITNIGKHFTMPYIFQTLFHWQGLSFWNKIAQITNRGVISKLKIPINFRDTFFMIAKLTLDK